jgi:signal transduction histidine kinase
VLLKRVEELLQVSRLDGGHLELEPRDVDVARLVRSSCEGFASVAELRDQTLLLEAPPSCRRAWTRRRSSRSSPTCWPTR